MRKKRSEKVNGEENIAEEFNEKTESEMQEETVAETDNGETKRDTSETGSDRDTDAKLAAAEAKAEEYLALAQRIQADFENFRRRNESVRAEAYSDGRKDVAALMLPVLDNLERAAEASETSGDEALKNGVTLVLKQMTEVYQKLDVTVIDRPGEVFDPNLENAIMQGTPEEGAPGTVCQVFQKGYRMGNKVIRHAMVKVVPES